MITRSFGNAFEVQDYTQEIALVPNTWTLIGSSGLFQHEYLSTTTVSFQETNGTLGLVGDAVRGARPQAVVDGVRKVHAYSIPFFPLVDKLTPQDLQNKSAYSNLDQADTEAEALARKMTKIRKSFNVTQEISRWKTLTGGLAYAPNGTIVADYYSDFGITKKTVDFVLGTATTDLIAKGEEVIAHMQENAFSDTVVTGVTAYCSPEFFAKLISHAKVQAAYMYYSSTQEPLRQRVGGQGLYRQFEFGGIRYVEAKGILGGERLVPAGKAVFVPEGVDGAFMTYFAPGDRLDLVNTRAEELYMFSFRDPKGKGISLEAEASWLNVLRRPALVVEGSTSN